MAQNGMSRTSGGLRETLFDAMDLLRKGDMDHNDAKAIALLSKEIIRTVQVEMEVARLRLQYPADAAMPVPGQLKLGAQFDAEQTSNLPKVQGKV